MRARAAARGQRGERAIKTGLTLFLTRKCAHTHTHTHHHAHCLLVDDLLPVQGVICDGMKMENLSHLH